LPQGNRLVDGEWWDATTTEPVVSLAQSWAEPLRVKVGDRIGVRVGTEEIDALIVNIREVQWENFNPNFFVLFPPNVFANAPHTFLSSTRLEGQNQDTLVSLNQIFPTINIIDIGAILKQVRRLLDLVGLTLNLVFGFTLAAGSVALYSVMQSGHEARVRDVAMLKVLGCDRRRIMMALGAEFLTISLIAGLVAGISASMIGWLLAAQIFDIPYQFNPFVLVFSVFLSAIIVAALSMSHVKHALRTAPKFALLWI
jgi:putative ABC transport system permease protein